MTKLRIGADFVNRVRTKTKGRDRVPQFMTTTEPS